MTNSGEVPRPTAPSPTAGPIRTEHSKELVDRLEDLRNDLLRNRRERRLLRANLGMALVVLAVVAGEVAALATRLVDQHVPAVAWIFAGSSLAALLGGACAIGRAVKPPEDGDPLSLKALGLVLLAVAAGVVGAYLAAWPS
jgi:hypothetical protein